MSNVTLIHSGTLPDRPAAPPTETQAALRERQVELQHAHDRTTAAPKPPAKASAKAEGEAAEKPRDAGVNITV